MSNYRVGIDCRLAGRRHAGIGRYVVELVKRVTTHPTIDWVLFYSDQEQIDELFGSTIPSNCELHHSPIRHYTVREQIEMKAIFTNASLDLLHIPHFNIPVMYSRPLVITIHDLLWHEHTGAAVTTLPAWQYWIKYCFYRLVSKVAVSKAKAIFVPTYTVQKTLKHYFPTSSTKVIVTPEGINGELLAEAKNKKQLTRKSKQLLYVGSLYPHKNVDLIVKSLHLLPDYELTIVSSRTVFRKNIEKLTNTLNMSDRVTFLENVPDSDLAQLYQLASALIQPSFSEGFGLTGLEAIAFSTPVIASDIPVFHEVYDKAAIYFDPHSQTDFVRAVLACSKPELVKALHSARASVLEKNNWDNLANLTYAKYVAILQSQQ